MSRWIAIAEIALAGALTGLMIGPNSAQQFVGVDFANSTAFNVIVGAAIGMVFGFVAMPSKPQAE